MGVGLVAALPSSERCRNAPYRGDNVTIKVKTTKPQPRIATTPNNRILRSGFSEFMSVFEQTSKTLV
jgi:hypothetical protein